MQKHRFIKQKNSNTKLRYFFGALIVALLLVALALPLIACNGDEATSVTITFIIDGEQGLDPVTIDAEYLLPYDFTKEGCEFGGWYLTSDYSGEPISVVTPDGKDITVYLKWSPKVYLLTLESSVLGMQLDAINVEYQADIELPTPQRYGYSLDGWCADADTTTPFELAKMPARDVVAYAKWSPSIFSVSFVTNSPQTLQPLDTPYDCTFDPPTPAMQHYEFIGWYYQVDYKDLYDSEDKMPANNITLYAKWALVDYAIVYYNTEGASHTNPHGYYVVTENIILSDASKLGYNFLGWYDAEEGGAQVQSIPTGSSGRKELHAKWSPIVYNITYKDAVGATNPNPNTYTIESELIGLLDLQVDGFIGWYSKSSPETSVEYISAGSYGNITLCAKWETYYAIVYNNAEGAYNPNPTAYNEYSNEITLQDAYKDHYDFLGWYDAPENGDKVETIASGSGDIELYAYWEAIKYETHYFGIEGIINVGDLPGRFSIEDEIILPELDKDGYIFEGWYDGDSPDAAKIEKIERGTTGDLYLYARWTPIE